MEVPNLDLFLGFPLESSFIQELNAVNPNIKSLYIQEGSEYLQQITHEGQAYLGKVIDKMVNTESLELYEANILSLIQKIVPNYPYSGLTLVLFSITKLR